LDTGVGTSSRVWNLTPFSVNLILAIFENLLDMLIDILIV
jgi:hypothetical protein